MSHRLAGTFYRWRPHLFSSPWERYQHSPVFVLLSSRISLHSASYQWNVIIVTSARLTERYEWRFVILTDNSSFRIRKFRLKIWRNYRRFSARSRHWRVKSVVVLLSARWSFWLENINAMHKEFTESINSGENSTPLIVNDQNVHLQIFFQHLEQLLQTDLKSKSKSKRERTRKSQCFRSHVVAEQQRQ